MVSGNSNNREGLQCVTVRFSNLMVVDVETWKLVEEDLTEEWYANMRIGEMLAYSDDSYKAVARQDTYKNPLLYDRFD